MHADPPWLVGAAHFVPPDNGLLSQARTQAVKSLACDHRATDSAQFDNITSLT